MCRSARINFDLVMSIVRAEHPLSRLVFGSIDFDNIDNVARMNWMLGLGVDKAKLMRLAETLGASRDVGLVLPEQRREDLQYWLSLRRQAYQILVFDAPTVAAQAVLSKALRIGLERGDLALEDWLYSDYQMIEALRESSTVTKRMLDSDFIGRLPGMCLLHHFCDVTHPIFDTPRDAIVTLVEDFLSRQRIGGRCYGYSFRDRGAFSKEVRALDPTTGAPWSLGERSDSLIVYGFSSKRAGEAGALDLGQQFAKWISSK